MAWWMVSAFGLGLDAVGVLIITYDLRRDYNRKKAYDAFQAVLRLATPWVVRGLNAEASSGGPRLREDAYPEEVGIENLPEGRLADLLANGGVDPKTVRQLDKALARVYSQAEWPFPYWGRPRDDGLTDIAWVARRLAEWSESFRMDTAISPLQKFRPALRWGAAFLVFGFLLQIIGTVGGGLSCRC